LSFQGIISNGQLSLYIPGKSAGLSNIKYTANNTGRYKTEGTHGVYKDSIMHTYLHLSKQT